MGKKRRQGPFLVILLLGVAALGGAQSVQPPRDIRDGAEFAMWNGAEPTLDPSLMNDMASTNVGLGLFEGLMQYDPRTNLGIPALAESYETSKDGLVVTFRLRSARWSDGHPITASDFVYAMERILDPATASDYAFLPSMVIKGAEAFSHGTASFEEVGIKAIDSRTLQYTLISPAPYFVDLTCHNAFWPLPRWCIEKWGSNWTEARNIVTNGPYLLAEHRKFAYVLLMKNRSYWDAVNVRLQSIRVFSNNNDSYGYDAYCQGLADWMRGVPVSKLDEIRLRPDYRHSPQFATYYYEFNVTKAPMDNVLVRQALAAAIDRQRLVDEGLGGGQIPSGAMTPPMEGYAPPLGVAFDPEMARRLLAQAGFPDGRGFPAITVIYNTNVGHKLIAESVQRQWKENLNIDVVLKDMEFRTLIELRSRTHDFTVARAGWVGDYLDPNTMLDLFVTAGGNNDGLWSNPEYDALIAAAARSGGAERMAMLQKAEGILLADAAIIPFYHYANQDLIDTTKWGGWFDCPLGIHPWKFIFRQDIQVNSTVAALP